MIKQANGLNITLIERKDEFTYNEFIQKQIVNWIDTKSNSNYFRVTLSDCNPIAIVNFISGGLYGKINKLLIIQCSELKSLEMKVGDSKLYKGKIPTLWDELCYLLPQYKNVKCLIAVTEISKASKVYKKIEDLGEVMHYENQTLRQYISFVNKRLKFYNITMEKEVVKYFLGVVDNNYSTIDSELKKLSLLDEKEITKNTIDWNVMRSKKAIVFDLINSIGRKKLTNSINLLFELIAQGTSGLQIIALLQRNFRILLYLHCNCDMSEFKLNKWALSTYKEQSRNFTTTEIIDILNEICDCEQSMKTTSAKEDLLLIIMLFECL